MITPAKSLDGSAPVRPIPGVHPALAVLLPVLLACPALACTPDQDPDTDASALRVPDELVDLDPAPDRVRVVVIAGEGTAEYLAGKPTTVWSYRDARTAATDATVPGPVLRAPLGASIEIELRNELPTETTIHWHGVRLPAAQDGTPMSQVAVAPGESFTYRFDAIDAGTFWYHPHVEADVQIERGLYGALVVEDDTDLDLDLEHDRVLILDDVKLDASGALNQDDDPLDLMLGRQGNVLLVNGQRRPSLTVAAGTRERWRFVNAANGRYFALRLDGASLAIIGSDGGAVPAPIGTTELLIAPGERYDVAVEFGEAIGPLTLETVHYDRGHNIPDPGPLVMLDVVVTAGAAEPNPLPQSLRTIEALPIDDDTPRRPLVLSENDDDAANPKFFIDGMAFPEGAPVMVDQDALEVWTLRNEAEMDHPFHIHGLFFQVLGESDVPDLARGWKDTVNIPRDASVSLAVRFDNPGEWMMHCHILEHAERGMMQMLHVMP